MKPYYEEKGITIYNADCREILPSLPKVDLVLTDPPYFGREDMFSTEAVLDVLNVLIPLSPAFVFWPCLADVPLKPDAIHIWHKSVPIHPHSTIGNVAGHHYERILAYGTGKRSEVFRVAAVMPNFAACIEECEPHPSQKPSELIKKLLGKVDADLILDPFMGSGTTLRAAKDLGRKAIGIEIEEKYCEIAANRLRQEVLQFV